MDITVLDLVVLPRSNSSMVEDYHPNRMNDGSESKPWEPRYPEKWLGNGCVFPPNIVIIGFDPFKDINIRCWVSLQISQIPKVQWFNHCHHVPAFKLALNLGFYILDTPILSYFGVNSRVLIGS